MNCNKLGLSAAALAMLMLILDSKSAAEAAAAGVDACIRTVIPTLFPFFLLSGYLTGSMGRGKFSEVIAHIFHAPRNCGGILLAGLLGGYPLGAKVTAEACRNGHLTKFQGDRLLMFCSQAGPSFLFGMAAAQLDGTAAGWKLWAVQLLSAWFVSLIFPLPSRCPIPQGHKDQAQWNDVMRSSLLAIGSVCGWVVSFCVMIRFLKRWILWLLPEAMQILVCGMLELTNGCLLLFSVSDPQQRFLLAAVMLNFGGLCVAMQTASVASGLDFRRYLLGKVIQAVISFPVALAVMGNFVFLIPLLTLYFFKNTDIFRKRSSNLIKHGV